MKETSMQTVGGRIVQAQGIENAEYEAETRFIFSNNKKKFRMSRMEKIRKSIRRWCRNM